MAENQVAEAKAEDYQYTAVITEAGPGAKKVTIEIPQEHIQSKLAEQFKEVRSQAAIPGFRIGHAPVKLIEKKFSTDIKEQVRRALVSESYQQVLEKNEIQPLGEPEIENADKLTLPETGAFSFSFTVEVQPKFTIPDLKGVKIKKPKIEVKEENIDQAMANLREQQGVMVPVEDRGITGKDFITADVHVKHAGAVIAHAHDTQIVSRPGRVGGVDIADLDKQLEGAKSGETRSITAKAPDQHPHEAARGQDLQIDVTVKDIKKLELAEINDEFLESLGFKDEKELREALREQMVERITDDVQQNMRDQMSKHLIDTIHIELPAKLSQRQAERVVQRRATDLLMRGLPMERIQANVDKLKTGAEEEATRELKLFFILQDVAKQHEIDVDEAELNGKIAMIAVQSGRRPEKVKQEMSKDGSLSNLYVQTREQKALDKILETADIELVEVKPEDTKSDSAST